jgi:hypothetical protein
VSQVVVGSILGFIFGSVWFYLVHNIFSKYFDIIVSWLVYDFNIKLKLKINFKILFFIKKKGILVNF